MNLQETFENMMPCVCDCGELFDLEEGHKSLHSNKVICDNCHELEEKEARIEELEESLSNISEEIRDAYESIDQYDLEIISLRANIENWEDEIKDIESELEKLKNE